MALSILDKYETALGDCSRYERVINMAREHGNDRVVNTYLDKIEEKATLWFVRITDLIEVFLERGYTGAIPELKDYAMKFHNFTAYVREEKSRLA